MRFVVHIFLWVTSVLFAIVLYPIKWVAYFKKSKKCPPIEDDLLLIPAVKLAELIRTKQVSSKVVIETYINRIKAVNPILNAVVEERFKPAIINAANVDVFLKDTTLSSDELKMEYPLLGLPITVKETVALEGLSFNGGVKTKVRNPATRDSQTVKQIKEAGGIPLLVSNTPELCLNWETCNKYTGTTVNPYDTRRTCGGSSGGEAVLLSTGSSILGLGSDLCGSIRLPSHFCGIYGHKPTGGSVSIDGTIVSAITNNNPLWQTACTVGPLTRYASDLPLLFDVILKPEVKESMPRIKIPITEVNIFYMEFDGDACMTHIVQKEIVRMLRRLVNQFKINGYSVKEAELRRMADAVDLAFLPLLTVDGIQTVFKNNRSLGGEILRTMVGCSNVQPTTILFEIVYCIAQRMITKGRKENIMKEVEAFRKDVSVLLGDNGVLLYPVFPSVAHLHGEVYSKTLDTSYMTIFNTLGFPATACPVGLDSKGLPIGVQIVGNFKMDRLCFAIAEVIEREFGGWRQPPFSERIERI